jgi:hypothetical protein
MAVEETLVLYTLKVIKSSNEGGVNWQHHQQQQLRRTAAAAPAGVGQVCHSMSYAFW